MPTGVAGNIFKGRDNNYYVTVLSERQRLQDKGGLSRVLSFKVSIKAVKKLKKVTYWGPGTKEQKAEFTAGDGTAEITLPKHQVVSMVKLTVKKTSPAK